jgi:hypothetical protein
MLVLYFLIKNTALRAVFFKLSGRTGYLIVLNRCFDERAVPWEFFYFHRTAVKSKARSSDKLSFLIK